MTLRPTTCFETGEMRRDSTGLIRAHNAFARAIAGLSAVSLALAAALLIADVPGVVGLATAAFAATIWCVRLEKQSL